MGIFRPVAGIQKQSMVPSSFRNQLFKQASLQFLPLFQIDVGIILQQNLVLNGEGGDLQMVADENAFFCHSKAEQSLRNVHLGSFVNDEQIKGRLPFVPVQVETHWCAESDAVCISYGIPILCIRSGKDRCVGKGGFFLNMVPRPHDRYPVFIELFQNIVHRHVGPGQYQDIFPSLIGLKGNFLYQSGFAGPRRSVDNCQGINFLIQTQAELYRLPLCFILRKGSVVKRVVRQLYQGVGCQMSFLFQSQCHRKQRIQGIVPYFILQLTQIIVQDAVIGVPGKGMHARISAFLLLQKRFQVQNISVFCFFLAAFGHFEFMVQIVRDDIPRVQGNLYLTDAGTFVKHQEPAGHKMKHFYFDVQNFPVNRQVAKDAFPIREGDPAGIGKMDPIGYLRIFLYSRQLIQFGFLEAVIAIFSLS